VVNMWRAVWVMAQKDVQIESRGKALYLSALSFGALTVLLLGFAADGEKALPANWTSGTLWLVVVLAALSSFARLDDKERYDGGLLGSLTAPVDRSVVFFSRTLSNLLFIYAVEIVTVPLYFLVLGIGIPKHLGMFVLVMILGTLAFVTLGTFLTAVVAASSLREILAPVLLLPLAVPLFLAVITLTSASLSVPSPLFHAAPWWGVVVGYVILFILLPGLLFELLVEV